MNEPAPAYYVQTITPDTRIGAGVLTFDPRTFTDYPSPVRDESVLWDGRVVVSKAENGLLLTVGVRRGEPYQTYIARDEQELKDILLSVIVAARLEK